MPIDFDKDLKTWRDDAPPETLKPRIAAALSPRPSFRWKPAAALAVAAAVAAFVALLPGSPVRPLPAFADVEKAMAGVKIVSFHKVFMAWVSNGYWWNREERVWIRRNPPAFASRIESGAKPTTQQTLMDGRRIVTYNPRAGKWNVTKDQYDIKSVIERDIRSLTEMPTDANSAIKLDPKNGVHFTVMPWSRREEMLGGKSVLRFDRKVVRSYEPQGANGQKQFTSKQPAMYKTITFRSTVWVDARTLRVVKRDSLARGSQGQIISRSTLFDFRYDEPAPPGVFDLTPTKQTPPTKRK